MGQRRGRRRHLCNSRRRLCPGKWHVRDADGPLKFSSLDFEQRDEWTLSGQRGNGGELETNAARNVFAFFHSITPGLTGGQRRALFELLPIELQDECWEQLGRALEARP